MKAKEQLSNHKEKKEFEIIDTRITDHWGVDWTPMEIVRDFLQNFYDANPINDITIKIAQRTVTVSAPSEFDYKSLIYLGSDKGNSDIGQYGEGFKAATVNAMRNHGCIVQVRIKNLIMEFFFKDEKIGETIKKVIMCKMTTTSKIIGTKLILKNCSQDIIDEFKFGKNYFYYETNPLFGKILTKHYSNDIFIYKSIQEDVGYIFYGKLLRAKLEVPLVIVCNRIYKSIDQKIKHDRDRKAFNDAVLEQLLKYIFKQVTIPKIVPVLKPWWSSGHKILRILSSGWQKMSVKFPENYYAKHSKTNTRNSSMQMEVDQIEREFQEKGYIQCPVYMAKFGMKNAVSMIRNRLDQIKKKHQTLYTRKPSELETQALNILKEYVRNIDSLLVNRFAYAKYTIGDSDEIVGELRIGRSYRANAVFLSKSFFRLNFADALAIIVHEWSHIYGYDGSRGFTDALTNLVAKIINNREKLDEVEENWRKISFKIKTKQLAEKAIPHMNTIVKKLSKEQRIQLLNSIPEEELMKLIEKENIDILFEQEDE